MNNVKNWCLRGLCVCIACASVNALAQNSDSGRNEVDEIVVEGELIERSIQDSQTSVAIITGEDLERSGDIDLYDVIERTPGIYSSFGEKGFAVRGIDQRSVGGGGTGLTVSTTVDGAVISNSNQLTFFGPYSIWDLGQVEILRGPQSTQTGRNALAGAIVIRSQDPIYETEGKLHLELGERDTRGAALAYNLPFSDKFAVRLSAEKLDTDGFVDNPTNDSDEYDARELETLRLGVRYDPTENVEAILKVTTTRNAGGEDLIDFASFPEQRINNSDLIAEEGSEMDSYNLRLGVDLSDNLKLLSETTYYTADYFRLEDGNNSPVPNEFLTRTSDIKSFQQELKLKFSGDRWSGAVGLFYTDFTDDAPASGVIDAGIFSPFFAGLGTISVIIDQNQDTENYAMFGEFEYQVSDKLRLIAGARFDNEETQTETVNAFETTVAPLLPFLPPASTEVRDADFDAFLPKLGVVYDISDNLSLGLVVQEGYRAGGVQVNLLSGQRNVFDPESTMNYEISLRSQSADRRYTLNGNLFYMDWEDQQVSVIGASGNPNDTNTVNAGESTVYGGELELQAKPNENLDYFISVALADTKFDKFESASGNFTGNEFPYASKVTASAGATFYFGDGYYTSVDISYLDGFFTDSANTLVTEVDSRTLAGLRVGYENDRWQVYSYVRNLFDEDYITQGVANGAGTGLSLIRTGEPRTVGVSATYKF